MDPAALFSLAGKRALVTGGSRGIGYAIAEAFLAAGASVVITARGEDGLRTAAASLGPKARGIRCDNADPDDIVRMVEDAWAGDGIDILVNNAGISPFYKRAELVTPAEIDQVTGVNVRGMYLCSVEVAKRLFAEGRPGSILSISSMLGEVPGERLGVYGATKAAVHQLTKVMALEWADRKVRVNAVAPGWTDTEFTRELFASRWGERLLADVPLGRMAQPEDVVGAALYLASDASAFVTGTILTVDGGRSLR